MTRGLLLSVQLKLLAARVLLSSFNHDESDSSLESESPVRDQLVLFKLPLVEGSILDEEAKTTKLQNKRKVYLYLPTKFDYLTYTVSPAYSPPRPPSASKSSAST